MAEGTLFARGRDPSRVSERPTRLGNGLAGADEFGRSSSVVSRCTAAGSAAGPCDRVAIVRTARTQQFPDLGRREGELWWH